MAGGVQLQNGPSATPQPPLSSTYRHRRYCRLQAVSGTPPRCCAWRPTWSCRRSLSWQRSWRRQDRPCGTWGPACWDPACRAPAGSSADRKGRHARSSWRSPLRAEHLQSTHHRAAGEAIWKQSLQSWESYVFPSSHYRRKGSALEGFPPPGKQEGGQGG